MSAETSQITDISGAASGTAQSKKATPGQKRVDPPRPAASSSPRPTEAAWPTLPAVDVSKFFEDGRERVREAFEQANGRFDAFRTASRETGDVLQESQNAALTGAKDVSEQLFDYAQAEVDRSYDFFKSAAEVKGVADLIQLQTDYVRETWETQIERSKALTELTLSAFKSTFAPLQTGFTSVFENARKRS